MTGRAARAGRRLIDHWVRGRSSAALGKCRSVVASTGVYDASCLLSLYISVSISTTSPAPASEPSFVFIVFVHSATLRAGLLLLVLQLLEAHTPRTTLIGSVNILVCVLALVALLSTSCRMVSVFFLAVQHRDRLCA